MRNYTTSQGVPSDYAAWCRSDSCRSFRPEIVDSVGSLRAGFSKPWSLRKYDAIATALVLAEAADAAEFALECEL
jgi:hypothetical protein